MYTAMTGHLIQEVQFKEQINYIRAFNSSLFPEILGRCHLLVCFERTGYDPVNASVSDLKLGVQQKHHQ